MALKTREDYIQSLKKMRPNVYKMDELITDVTTHPATKRLIETHAIGFDGAHDEKTKDLFTKKSSITGEVVHRWTDIMTNHEEQMMNSKFKRQMFRLTGTCHASQCVGWQILNVLWGVTHDIDKEHGTKYHERLKNYIIKAQENGWTMAGALTDGKGDRSLNPTKQPDPDAYVHIVERRDDGIVVRGCKAMIAAVAAANEVFVVPTTGLGPDGADYAVGFAVPRDIEGLTIVECRGPSDGRAYEGETWDYPDTDITQGYLIFDNVFVPNERVFMAGEFKYAGEFIGGFTANYRANIGACVAGQGDNMIGSAVIVSRANGISEKKFYDKIVDMAIYNETTYVMGIGSVALGHQHAAGNWLCDTLSAHANKYNVGYFPWLTKRLCQDICGGLVETGCFPSYKDFQSEQYGDKLKKYFKAGPASAEVRAKAARVAEWLTVGGGIPGCMHGGGSPDGARLVVRLHTPIEEFVGYAKRVARIDEDIPDPAANKK